MTNTRLRALVKRAFLASLSLLDPARKAWDGGRQLEKMQFATHIDL